MKNRSPGARAFVAAVIRVGPHLLVQVHSLQLLSQARPLWDHLIPFVVVARVQRFGQDVDSSFKLGQISRRARNDLRSDYNYMLGHTERGRAQPFADEEAAETALAAAQRRRGAKQVHLNAAAHAREQKEMHLLRAVMHFQNALIYHPYWVPALLNLKQVYGQLGPMRENDLKRINAVLPEWRPREEAAPPSTIA